MVTLIGPNFEAAAGNLISVYPQRYAVDRPILGKEGAFPDLAKNFSAAENRNKPLKITLDASWWQATCSLSSNSRTSASVSDCSCDTIGIYRKLWSGPESCRSVDSTSSVGSLSPLSSSTARDNVAYVVS